ncbi:hypothetical protein ACGFX8_24650 [Streptomyces sp. NPDC048362]|uniref:hypothetical protein n=1 Tax=Streptomyces sp. NPDC048362 TaxID=3365539 RepID=UPI0037131D72
MAVIITEDGRRVIGDNTPQPVPSVKLTDPDHDPRTGEWKREEWEQEQASDFRKRFPADFFTLPAANPSRRNPQYRRDDWLSRLWASASDAPGMNLEQARSEYREACWAWCGAHQSDGRSVVKIHGKVRSLPRTLWTLLRGGAPDTRKLVVRTCHDRGAEECVNPWHAELMTRSEATARQRARDLAA